MMSEDSKSVMLLIFLKFLSEVSIELTCGEQ